MFAAAYRRKSVWSDFSDWVRSWMPARNWPSQLKDVVDVDELTDQVAQRIDKSWRNARQMSRAALREARRGGRRMTGFGEDAMQWAGRPNTLKIAMVVAGLGILAIWAGRRQ